MPARVKLPFALPKTGHYGSAEHYRLEPHGRPCDGDARLVESSPRGFRLARALGGYGGTVGWHLTPARTIKWVELFDVGMDWDERGYFIYADGGRYDSLPVALAVAADLRRAST